jgi:radical SAM superfamily enzyme YgiQ (UPF0313 family)
MSKIDVVLVGREQPHDENLALRYLAAALAGARHRPTIVPLCGPDQLVGAVAAVLERRPPLVGISIPDADIAVDALAFIRMLRARGYRGHVTLGGALATLVRAEILAKHPGVDSIVRHDGELPIIEMADRLGAGRALDGVPGLTTRAGDGVPAEMLLTPLHLRPLRPRQLPRILGVPVARLLASRGCPGRCPYCGPAALQRSAIEEGLRGGAEQSALTAAGIGGVRRRSPVDVADEVASLYHDRGVRLLHLLDDNLLAGSPAHATAWLRALVAELEARGVRRAAWSLQVDPALVTEEVADALVALGAIRVLLGVEALTVDGLRALGRPGDPSRSRAALERLRARGVVTLFNSILVHPGATPESIHAELDALGTLEGIHFDALSMAVYPGTDAWQRLCAAGEVSGGMLGWRFEPRDPVVSRFRAAIIRLRLEGTGRYGANVLAHDVAVNLAMARRLELAAWNPELERALGAATDEIAKARLAAWQKAALLAATEMSNAARAQATGQLVAELSRALSAPTARIEGVQASLERAQRVAAGPSNLLVRSALAAGFTLMLAPGAGCSASHEPASDAGSDAGMVEVDAGLCAPAEVFGERTRARTMLGEAGCPQCADTVSYGIALDAAGHVVDVRRSDGSAVSPDVRACYVGALAGETFPCLSGEEVWAECVICLF